MKDRTSLRESRSPRLRDSKFRLAWEFPKSLARGATLRVCIPDCARESFQERAAIGMQDTIDLGSVKLSRQPLDESGGPSRMRVNEVEVVLRALQLVR